MANHEDELDLGKYVSVLRRAWSKILLTALAVSLCFVAATYLMKDTYQATAVVAPATEERKPIAGFGALSTIGVEIFGASKAEDLEALFTSNDLTVRVFRNHSHWSIIYPERFNSATGMLRTNWIDRLFAGENVRRTPGDWDAIRGAKSRLAVRANRRNGTVSISFESPSPVGSAEILTHYLEEAKDRLQEEALHRATTNKKFIQDQIGRTVDALTRDRLFTLYGQEVEREMLARNREQFGFRVIDGPRVPDRRLKPRRSRWALFGFFLSLFGGCIFFILRGPLPERM